MVLDEHETQSMWISAGLHKSHSDFECSCLMCTDFFIHMPRKIINSNFIPMRNTTVSAKVSCTTWKHKIKQKLYTKKAEEISLQDYAFSMVECRLLKRESGFLGKYLFSAVQNVSKRTRKCSYFLSALGLANTVYRICPQNKIGHRAHSNKRLRHKS